MIKRQPVRLAIWPVRPTDVRALVPIEAEEAQGFHNQFEAVLNFAFLIGILHAQNKFAAGMLRPQPLEKRGANIPHVWRAGWTRRKANANRFGSLTTSFRHHGPPSSTYDNLPS